MLQSLPELKRDGDTILGATLVDLLYNDASSLKAGSLLKQMESLPILAEQLKQNPTEVVKALEEIRELSQNHRCRPGLLTYSWHSIAAQWHSTLRHWQCDAARETSVSLAESFPAQGHCLLHCELRY